MKSYRSHKVVQAASITGHDGSAVFIQQDEKDAVRIEVPENFFGRGFPKSGDYLVRYGDGYLSWSPKAAFEEGYAEHSLDPKDGALPVSGYKPQTERKVAIVNAYKEVEERILRLLDDGKSSDQIDQRWLAIGRTHLEQAFMAINRSVFQPGRVRLPEDLSG